MPNFKIPKKGFFQNLKILGCEKIIAKKKLMDVGILYHIGGECMATTPRIIMQNLGHDVLARSVGPISFYGGPPGHSHWYKGSLLTFVLDSVFYKRAIS